MSEYMASEICEVPKCVSGRGNDFEEAVCDWREMLGEGGVKVGGEIGDWYGVNTIGVSRRIPVVLVPESDDDVRGLMEVAQLYGVKVYPISCGKNWGYGAANPVVDDCVIMDCSRMNRIVDYDSELGLVTVEPGVTAKQLSDYLCEHGNDYLVPVSGAGPDASILGNALERGYGITPYADHFGAVMSIEAVLPTGELYRSALTGMGGGDVDRAFKWGVGPYLDGIFTQSNFGVVTRMTIALAPKPERIEAFFFMLKEEENFEGAVEKIGRILRKADANIGSINLMNTQRVLAMMEDFPSESVGDGEVMSREVIERMAKPNHVRSWMGVGAIYGSGRIVKETKRIIRRELRGEIHQMAFFTLGSIRLINRVLSMVPGFLKPRVCEQVGTLEAALMNMAGAPSDIALPLAYWKSGRKGSGGEGGNMDPAKDGCGLIWYSPLIPMKGKLLRRYVERVKEICISHGIEPLITLTSLSFRCFDSTVPLLFDRDDDEAVARAKACYDALFDMSMEEGFLPYRMSVDGMSRMVDSEVSAWQLAGKIKRAVDPKGILSPGRYCPVDDLG